MFLTRDQLILNWFKRHGIYIKQVYEYKIKKVLLLHDTILNINRSSDLNKKESAVRVKSSGRIEL